MSSRSFSENGFGIYTYHLKPTKEAFLNLIKKAKLEKALEEFILENTECTEFDINKIDVNNCGTLLYDETEVDEYDDWFDNGYFTHEAVFEFIALAIKNEITEKTGDGSYVVYANDSEGGDTNAIMMLDCAPWYYRENNIKLLTYKEYEEIFAKWLKPFVTNGCFCQFCTTVCVEQYG